MAHALLSPSAAHRWMHCTPSARLESSMEDKGSKFAEEGTLAHACCSKLLRELTAQPLEDEQEIISRYWDEYHTGEMDEAAELYKSIVMGKFNEAKVKTPDAQLLVEVRLDLTKYMPDAFGTADAIIIADGLMEVIDFKYGKGVKVEATENPQMMIYALGAYEAFTFEYNINAVRMTIIQPRIDNLSEYKIDASDLLAWGSTQLMPKAKLAYEGKGDQMPGEWCQFCKVKALCGALGNKCMDTWRTNKEADLISREDMERDVLPNLAMIKSWCSTMEEYALSQALSGVKYNGFKVVEGRSLRRIKDTEAVKKILLEHFSGDVIMKPQELRGIGDLEKLAGKKRFAELCGAYIDKPQGKPTLVPESDKRPPYNSASEDFKDVNL